MNFEELNRQIVAFPNKKLGSGASHAQIADAENQLGARFSASYRSFLTNYGWACFAHQEMYGLGCDVPKHLDLVRNVEAERNEMRPPIPRYLVPIMNDGAGNHYCLDTRKFTKDESPVVFWDHELGDLQQPQWIAETFVDWLAKQLKAI